MRATYIGFSTHGFEKGKDYYIRSNIQIVSLPYGNVYKPVMCICIYDENRAGWCAYRSLEEVLMNWKF